MGNRYQRSSGGASALMELLESRRLMSVSLHNGLLEVFGTPGADAISVSFNASTGYSVAINRDPIRTFPSNQVQAIAIHGGKGNDEISCMGGLALRTDALDLERVESAVAAVQVPVTIAGGSGDDEIFGGKGNDLLIGGDGNDDIRGYGGNDTILGGPGADLLGAGENSENGNDVIRGGAGNDSINGGAGNDTVDGCDGNDLVFGGGGSDKLFGGPGANTFSLHSALTDPTDDTTQEVLDFSSSDVNASASMWPGRRGASVGGAGTSTGNAGVGGSASLTIGTVSNAGVGNATVLHTGGSGGISISGGVINSGGRTSGGLGFITFSPPPSFETTIAIPASVVQLASPALSQLVHSEFTLNGDEYVSNGAVDVLKLNALGLRGTFKAGNNFDGTLFLS